MSRYDDDTDYAARFTGRTDLSVWTVESVIRKAIVGSVFAWLFRRPDHVGEPTRRTFLQWARHRWQKSFLNGLINFWWWLRRTHGYENAED